MELAKQTDGAFDPTCAPLINRWGFGYEERPEAAQAESLECLKTYVGYDKIELSNDVIVKQDPRVQLNFSAIGDGFACEVIARYLEGQGVRDYLVDIGGEMIASGKNPSGNDWSVGIVQPPTGWESGRYVQCHPASFGQGGTRYLRQLQQLPTREWQVAGAYHRPVDRLPGGD